jgi:hypothetical protein
VWLKGIKEWGSKSTYWFIPASLFLASSTPGKPGSAVPWNGYCLLSSFPFKTVSDHGLHEQRLSTGVADPDLVHAQAAIKGKARGTGTEAKAT